MDGKTTASDGAESSHPPPKKLKLEKDDEDNFSELGVPGPSSQRNPPLSPIKQEEAIIKDDEEVLEPEETLGGATNIKTAYDYATVYQFNISLKRMKPRIWRRLQVPGNYHFNQLHVAILKCMGWSNLHLHQFYAKNKETGLRDLIVARNVKVSAECYDSDGDGKVVSEKEACIADYFVEPKDKANYEYDLSSPWEHEVVLEKIIPRAEGVQYPKCVAGKNPTPPEDDPGSSDDEEWRNVKFDPKSVFTEKL